MGILHCIDSGCAEVRYQPYQKTGGIRYRYPGEEWVTVDGDNYELQENPESCRTSRYREHAYVTFRREYSDGSSGYGVVQFVPDWGGRFISATFEGNTITVTFDSQVETTDIVEGYRGSIPVDILSITSYGRWWGEVINDDGEILENGWAREEDAIRLHGQQICTDESCTIIIYQDNQLVHYATGSSCPIIASSCELSDRYETIKIEKVLYLERIEIRDQEIQGYGVGGTLIDSSPLPTECLNIYKTFTAAPPFPNNTVPTAAIFNPYEFVAQICSDPGCPPPEYTVVCRCGEECPEGTCPVFCGDHVCCHDPNTGDAVYQIPLGEYSGGGL